MAIPAEHQVYLQKKDYTPQHAGDFTTAELALLRQYGHWLEALAAGWIAPSTPEQRRFLQVVHGEAEAKTPFELVWRKLRPASEEAEEATTDESASWPKLRELAEVRSYADGIAARKEADRAVILATIQAKLDAIEAQYAAELEEANRAVAELEAEVKAAVLAAGKSVRAGPVHAVFYRGSVTWDSKRLAEYAQRNPDVEQFRRVGAPRVSIRYR
jgi:uncharacterized protein YifE (UPF0438 family)